jgi:DNA polymerase/3'-5' exonuclease PolX
MKLEHAQKIAVDICYKLQPHCEKINIAGSIRRQKEDAGDVEIICIPNTTAARDLFGAEHGRHRTFEFQHTVALLGEKIKGDVLDGRYMQIMLPQSIKLDLFMPLPDDYYRQYAIRTGSAEFAHKVIANAWLKKGWCGTTNNGLCRQSDCVKQGDKWNCITKKPMKPLPWQSEEEFFAFIGVQWVHPTQREIATAFEKNLSK